MGAKNILSLVVCPSCKSGLSENEGLYCRSCGVTYPVIDGIPHLLVEYDGSRQHDMSRRYKYKSRIRNSRFFKCFKYIFGADFIPYNPLHKFNNLFLDTIRHGGLVLNSGSGSTRLTDGIINIDIEQFPNVDVVADGCRLPFPEHTFDAVISDAVIEHIKYPQAYVAEIKKVLKPEGSVFIVAPFVHPFHGCPSDFQRYSIEGIKVLFEDFDEIESGVYRGQGVAFVNFTSDYLAGFFCTKPAARIILKSFFTLFLFPLKFLDVFLNKRSDAFVAAHCVYFIGKKRKKEIA
jgi:uncharacterized protein YbaR (Trm112 family)